MTYFFLLFIIMPILEIWLILKVGALFGVFPTFALILITAALGMYLLRREGYATLFRAQEKMAAGAMPAHEMAEGMMLAFSGALLLTPGFVTDTVGFLLLSASVRRLLIKQLSSHFKVVESGSYSSHPESERYEEHKSTSESGDYIEGEFRREDDKK